MEVPSAPSWTVAHGTVCLRIGLLGLFLLSTRVRGLELNGDGGGGVGSPTCLNLTVDVGQEVTLVCPTGNQFLFVMLNKDKDSPGGLTQNTEGSTLHIKRFRKSSEGIYFCGRQTTKEEAIGVVAIINVTLSGREKTPRQEYPHFLYIVTGLSALCSFLIFFIATMLCMACRQRRGKARLQRSRYKPDSSVSDFTGPSPPRPPSRSQSQATCITVVECFSEASITGSPQREHAQADLHSQSRSASVENLAVPKHNAKKYAYAVRHVQDVIQMEAYSRPGDVFVRPSGDEVHGGGDLPSATRSCHTTTPSALPSAHYSSSTIPKRNSRTG